MSILEVISLIASLISVIIGLLAIWLSIQFYVMSNKSSEAMKNASKEISSSVNRLEKLFDRFYSDTFSVMKETYSDMRRHIWPEQQLSDEGTENEIENKSDPEVDKIKDEVNKELSRIIKNKQEENEAKIRELSSLLNKAMSKSRNALIKTQEKTVRNYLLYLLRNMEEQSLNMSADSVIVKSAGKFPFSVIIKELKKMQRDNLIEFSTPVLGPRTIISLK
jgi:hypothetical protein